ncbi:hypothetical protein [Glutamicibacter soli]
MTEEAKAYTPTTEQVREDFATSKQVRHDDTRRAGFDRWLATVKAEALNDVADQMRDRFTAAWLRGKANEHIYGPRKNVGAFALPETKETSE